MSAVEAPLGHREVIEGLWRARRLGRLPHALLFEGPAGIGKFLAARWFAQGLYCADLEEPSWSEPCGQCGGCKRFAAGTHPDFYLLDPLAEELESIPVGRIAARDGAADSVCDFYALRSMEGGARIVLIREFERANTQAQNALLKTLEEPGESALLILESARPDLLLETVRSRCVTVRFEALNQVDSAQVLSRRGQLGAEVDQLVAWAGGSPGKALDLAQEGAGEVRAIIAAFLRGERDALEASQAVLEAPGEFGGKTPTAQTRARTRAALDLLCAVLRDGLHHNAGVNSEDLSHGDLAGLAVGEELAWGRALEEVVALRGEVELNLSPLGVLDRAFLALPTSS